MKCPKCGYLGFEEVERCRNCGYDFSLAPIDRPADLPIRRPAATPNPLDDLSLIDAANAADAAAEPLKAARSGADRLLDFPEMPAAPHQAAEESSDLPLFRSEFDLDDEPLITTASAPRPPLAVRRATPEIPRLRGEQARPQALDLALDLEDPVDAEGDEIVTPAARASIGHWPAPRPDRPENASIGLRLVAVIIDLVILAAVDLAVVYFTMQICGLTFEDLTILPKGPLLAFLVFQNGGYLAAFTAGGQTLGKLATGIRVVATESAGPLDFGRAVTRTVVWMMLAVPAGLGFLTLFSRDHRGLHDRFAGTRVVRAPV
jgi:uncharacterized RDD family membrane protein YckC